MEFFRRLFGTPASATKTETPKAETAPADPEAAIETAEQRAVMEDRATAEIPAAPAAPTSPYPQGGATQQLPVQKAISFENAHLSFGQATDIGQVSEKNEDSAFSYFAVNNSIDEQPEFGLFIVADGMGGHKGGERASAIAVRLVATELINALYLPLLAGSDRAEQPPMSEILDKALQRANSAIHEAISEGGGTTCTTAVVLRDMVYVAHVGDSRCYLITKDSIEQLTRDHSVVQRLVELGQLTQEDALAHPRGHELYRVLGFKESVDVDIFSRRLSARSRLLLCSDGLWNLVHESDLRHIVLDATSPQDACNALIARANMAGGRDNITAIVVQPK